MIAGYRFEQTVLHLLDYLFRPFLSPIPRFSLWELKYAQSDEYFKGQTSHEIDWDPSWEDRGANGEHQYLESQNCIERLHNYRAPQWLGRIEGLRVGKEYVVFLWVVEACEGKSRQWDYQRDNQRESKRESEEGEGETGFEAEVVVPVLELGFQVGTWADEGFFYL